MDATQTEARPQADVSFLVVRNGVKYLPILVQRESMKKRAGSSSRRKTYPTAYLPKDSPSPSFVSSEDAH